MHIGAEFLSAQNILLIITCRFQKWYFLNVEQVDNINEAMKDLKAKGVRLLSEDAKIGAHGKPVVFLHPKDCNGVLVELEQV